MIFFKVYLTILLIQHSFQLTAAISLIRRTIPSANFLLIVPLNHQRVGEISLDCVMEDNVREFVSFVCPTLPFLFLILTCNVSDFAIMLRKTSRIPILKEYVYLEFCV